MLIESTCAMPPLPICRLTIASIITAVAISGHRQVGPRQHSRRRAGLTGRTRCFSSTLDPRAWRRKLKGTPRIAASDGAGSSIPTGCRSPAGAPGLRSLAEGQDRSTSSLTTAPCPSLRQGRFTGLPLVVGPRAPEDRARANSSLCSTAFRKYATRCAPPSWSPSGAGTCARRGTASDVRPAGNLSRTGARHADCDLTARRAPLARHQRGSTCAFRPVCVTVGSPRMARARKKLLKGNPNEGRRSVNSLCFRASPRR